ncbi:MAG TPA: PD-(D/E)XK nuclease family protein [Coriobacteriia bacterium]
MALTIVTGRANTGKTGVVHDAVRRAADEDRRPALLLPTYPDVLRATAELARTHPVGIAVEQLDDWAAGLWALYGDGRRPVQEAQRAAIMSAVVRAARLRALARSGETPGFVTLLSHVARRAAEEQREALREAAPGSQTDAEIVALVTAYFEALDTAGLIEPGEACRRLAASPPSVLGPVFVHRFSDLSSSQEVLLGALAGEQDVWISLPWEEGFPATEALNGLVERLSAGATRLHCPAQPEGPAGELARLEAGLFREPRPGPQSGAVVLCTAAGAEAEAAIIAEQAAAACARFGPDRVAIVFRDAARHVDRLRVALAGAGVPADFDVLVPVVRTPYGRAVRRLLENELAPEKTEPLLTFLRSPFSGADQPAVDELDAKWRARRPAGVEQVRSQASRAGRDAGRALALARRLHRRRLDVPAVAEWQELADVLLSSAHPWRELQEQPDAEVDAAAHRALLDVVDRLAEVGGGDLGCAEVLAALEEARTSPGGVERQGHVQVTEAHRLRSRRFDAVIVGGMTAGDFSAEGRSSVAADIAQRLFGGERPTEQSQERLLFYNVCTRARERLVLVRRTADSDGNPLRPSVFWEEALDLYRPPLADADGQAEAALLSDSVRLSDLDRAAPALAVGRARLRARATHSAATTEGLVGAGGRGLSGVERHELRDAETLAWLADREEFSATELEVYARCPYRWFYERVVRPASLDVTFDALRSGDLAHRVLARFYAEVPARLGAPRVTPEVLGEALALAGEVFERTAADPGVPAPATLAEEDELSQTRDRVRALVASDAHFLPGMAPAHAELRFGGAHHPGDGAEPAPAVDLGGLRLRGSIDRIDAGDAGLAVIDYKTGTAPKLADFGPQGILQVPLYAAVASKLLGRPVVAGLYRSLKRGDARGFYRRDVLEANGLTSTDAVDDANAVDEIVGAALVTARAAADGIRAGRIDAEPSRGGACEYCAAAPVCERGA